jgi:hypothetical protein
MGKSIWTILISIYESVSFAVSGERHPVMLRRKEPDIGEVSSLNKTCLKTALLGDFRA